LRFYVGALGNLCGALLTIPLIFLRISFGCSNYENVLYAAASAGAPTHSIDSIMQNKSQFFDPIADPT